MIQFDPHDFEVSAQTLAQSNAAQMQQLIATIVQTAVGLHGELEEARKRIAELEAAAPSSNGESKRPVKTGS